MTTKPMNMQDMILNNMRKDRQMVTMHLVNGLPLRGYVRAFDSFVIVMDSPEGKQMIVYKHAVSTLTPSRPVPYSQGLEREENTSGPKNC